MKGGKVQGAPKMVRVRLTGCFKKSSTHGLNGSKQYFSKKVVARSGLYKNRSLLTCLVGPIQLEYA